MKSLHVVKRIMIGAVIFLGFTLILIGQVPALPSSKPIAPENSGTEIRKYVLENLFAIVGFIVSLVIGLLIEVYGLLVRRNIRSLKIDSSATVMLGLFILVSGIWILTDSRILAVFTTDYGGILDKNAVIFISYISFMLLPIIFVSFLQNIIQMGKHLWKIDGLFILNLSAFIILTIFHLSKEVYFILLMSHHALIYILAIIGAVYGIRSFRGAKDMQKKWLLRGLLCFMLFGCGALVVFFFGFPRLYVAMYSAGLAILMWYMVKITLHKMVSAYNQSMKTALYQSMAYTDILTDLKNRNAFIKEQYDRSVKENTCCIVIDINKLKSINDTIGHSYGDELIRRSARVVDDFLSDIGVCYRIGGDEFAVVCQDSDEISIKKTIEKMKNFIAATNSDSEPKISLACGYAFGGNDITQFRDLFDAADKNMYFDKRGNLSHNTQS